MQSSTYSLSGHLSFSVRRVQIRTESEMIEYLELIKGVSWLLIGTLSETVGFGD